jgi:hypothetical protein
MPNFIELGIDLQGFEQSKEDLLNRYIALFDNLSKYDGRTFNITMGGGLTDFNNSIKDTSRLLDEINAKMSSLGGVKVTGTSGATKETNELALAVAAYKKQADDAARASATLSAQTSEQAKTTAALKVQLSETTRALMDEAKANNASHQERLQSNKTKADEAKAEKDAVKTKVDLDKQAKIDAKNKTIEDKQLKDLNNDYLMLNKTLRAQMFVLIE